VVETTACPASWKAVRIRLGVVELALLIAIREGLVLALSPWSSLAASQDIIEE
jgi:hypothetical protein